MYNCIIMGAAGRDFHNFRSFFLERPESRVCAFTATQIPFISGRRFPRELAGAHYDADIPIHDEDELPRLIREHRVDFVFFSYSDLPHQEVMHRASIVQAAGASFVLLGPNHTCLPSHKPIVAVTGTRTGAGKSPLTQYLAAAESEAEVILWDGGNNDFAFFRPDLNIVVADALRAGHGLDYYPGETNFRAADILVINNVAQAIPDAVQTILSLHETLNPGSLLVQSDLELAVENADALQGKAVLVVEDGPTVTHGGMACGAGMVAAKQCGVTTLVDPRPHAVGTLADTLTANPHLERVLPAMGYSQEQRSDLKATIEASGAEVILDASPADIGKLLDLAVPVVRVSYRWMQRHGPDLLGQLRALLAQGAA